MQKSTSPDESFDETGPGAGDADAQKTTYVVGQGTDDRAGQRPAKKDSDAVTQPPRDVEPRRGTGPDSR